LINGNDLNRIFDVIDSPAFAIEALSEYRRWNQSRA